MIRRLKESELKLTLKQRNKNIVFAQNSSAAFLKDEWQEHFLLLARRRIVLKIT